MTIHELHQKLVAKELSAVELTNAVIAHKAKTEPVVDSVLSTLFISSCALLNLLIALPSVLAIAGSLSGPKIKNPNSRMRNSSNPPIPNKANPFVRLLYSRLRAPCAATIHSITNTPRRPERDSSTEKA